MNDAVTILAVFAVVFPVVFGIGLIAMVIMDIRSQSKNYP